MTDRKLATEMVHDLYERLLMYREQTIDPDSTHRSLI